MPSSLAPLLVAVCLLALTCAAPALAADATPTAPQKDELLFSQSSPRAILEPTNCRCDGRYILTLRHVDKHTVWFSDRPNRHAGHMTTRNFTRAWSGFGFRSDPPDAALSALDNGRRLDVVVELTHPRYDAKRHRMRYVAQTVPHVNGSLETEHSTDGLTGRFDDVSLFIDDATALNINGCFLVAGTNCTGAYLQGVHLSGDELSWADLTDANLTAANLYGANLTSATLSLAILSGANLENANLSGARLRSTRLLMARMSGANLAGADLSNANVGVANLSYVNLRYANLSHANLSGTYLVGADLTHALTGAADLTNANLTDAVLTGSGLSFTADFPATFCRTTMTDGSINNRDC